MQLESQVICISGIDGCGKTSIINGLRDELERNGVKTRYLWLRYNHYLTKILLVFCRLIGLTRYEYPDGVRVGYHDFYRSRVISWLFIFLTYIDTLIVSFVLVYVPMLLNSRGVLICDRWLPDIMVDLEVDTRVEFTNNGWLEKLFRLLLPARAKSFLIARDKASVLDVRPENERDANFPYRWKLYEAMGDRPWVEVIHNDATIDDAVAAILRQVVKGG